MGKCRAKDAKGSEGRRNFNREICEIRKSGSGLIGYGFDSRTSVRVAMILAPDETRIEHG